MRHLLQFARDHIILFGSAKFIAGLVIGFGLGVYFLPILTAEKGLSETELAELTSSAQAQTQLRTGEFVRDLEGSDAFHWGEGTIYVRDDRIWLDGSIAPGPDYHLCLNSLVRRGFQGQRDGPIRALLRRARRLPACPVRRKQDASRLPVPAYWLKRPQ